MVNGGGYRITYSVAGYLIYSPPSLSIYISCPLNIATFYREGSEPGLGAVATGYRALNVVPFFSFLRSVVWICLAYKPYFF